MRLVLNPTKVQNDPSCPDFYKWMCMLLNAFTATADFLAGDGNFTSKILKRS